MTSERGECLSLTNIKRNEIIYLWYGNLNGITLCFSKNVTFIFVISLLVSIQFCQLLAKTYSGQQAHIHGPILISFCMFVLDLVETGDASERTLRRRPIFVYQYLFCHLT